MAAGAIDHRFDDGIEAGDVAAAGKDADSLDCHSTLRSEAGSAPSRSIVDPVLAGFRSASEEEGPDRLSRAWEYRDLPRPAANCQPVPWSRPGRLTSGSRCARPVRPRAGR